MPFPYAFWRYVHRDKLLPRTSPEKRTSRGNNIIRSHLIGVRGVQDSPWPHYHLEEFPQFSLCGLSVTLSNIEPIRCPSDHLQIPSYSFLDFHIRSRWILDAVSLLSPTTPLCKLEKGTRSQVQHRASGDSLGSRGRAELWARLYRINLFAEATVLALVWFNFIKQMLRKYSLSLSLWCQLISTFLSHSIGSLSFSFIYYPLYNLSVIFHSQLQIYF